MRLASEHRQRSWQDQTSQSLRAVKAFTAAISESAWPNLRRLSIKQNFILTQGNKLIG
jgi:hypothetical protein